MELEIEHFALEATLFCYTIAGKPAIVARKSFGELNMR
jgi:hypothetical protein